MGNPFRSEAEAFRFLLGAVVYFAAIAIAGVINAWAGLAVFIILTVGVAWWWWHTRQHPVPRQVAPTRRSAPGERRLLVVANETVGGADLLDRIRELSAGANTEVLVVTPALNTKLRHLASDEDPARAQAQERLERSLQRLVEQRIGLSPKWLLQRRRLHDAVEALKAGRGTLAEVAADLGYADQAHFGRDWRAVTGVTPGEFAAEPRGG